MGCSSGCNQPGTQANSKQGTCVLLMIPLCQKCSHFSRYSSYARFFLVTWALINSVLCRILGSQVVRVDVTDPRHKCVYTEDGRSFEFDHLVSTMPLDILICSIDGLKDFSKKQLRAASEQFRCVFFFLFHSLYCVWVYCVFWFRSSANYRKR